MDKALISFRQSLESLRNTTPAGDSFFIFEQLRGIVTKALVDDFTNPWIPEHRRAKVAENIMKDGLRLFCILVHMDRVDQITNFLAHNTLDNRLPIKEEAEFRLIAPDLNIEFYTKVQWEFFPWVFQRDSGHIIFPSLTVLPFTKDDKISEGSGGVISIATIPVLQQEFWPCEDGQTVKVVRKQIKKRRSSEATERIFEDEKDCLELYRVLRHPNIISLLGSFDLSGEHHLLFPYFPMDLDAFLKEKDRYGEFRENSTFTAAVADLASALRSVHEVNMRSRTTPTFLTSYGYHHDIRPANILATPTTFILADFGLAYPKPALEPPVTKWAENIGHYIAPECMDKSFEAQLVGRSYDIWAFGCLVSEIATYMEMGPAGVEEFRAKRITPKFYDEAFENGYFFEGQLLKQEVSYWLQALSDQAQNRIIPSLVALSKGMLHPDPDHRPDMAVSSIRLSFVHAKRLFQSACESVEETLSKVGQPRHEVSVNTITELKIEFSKLKAFGAVLGMNGRLRLDCELFTKPSFATFVHRRLERIYAELRRSRKSLADYMHAWTTSESKPGLIKELIPLKFIDESVRKDIRELCEALPRSYQYYLNHLSLKYLLESSQNERSLREIEEFGKEIPDLYANIGVHAKLQRLDQALRLEMDTTGPEEQDLILDWSQVEITSTFSRNHHLGLYDFHTSHTGDFNQGKPRRVLIEWVLFSQFPDGESEDERIGKLLVLAGLLHCPKPRGFRILDCLGFLPPQATTHQGFGFVYPFPSNKESSEAVEPITLRRLFDRANFTITLGDKFNIVQALSSSLFELHCHHWLHKNIRSDNIIFFVNATKQNNSSKGRCRLDSGPYLIGFHHGRPDSQIFYSDVPSTELEPEASLYQHPEYKHDVNRFQKAYDYYSLGIVLLEVAFWHPVQAMWEKHGKSKNLAGKAFQQNLVDRFVPKLAEVMGNAYMDATTACLSGGFGPTEERIAQNDDISQFYWNVVEKLDACYVKPEPPRSPAPVLQ